MRKLVLFIVSLQFLLTGCAQNEVRDTTNNLDENFITVNESNNDQNRGKSEQQIAENLVKIANKVPNVKEATAVVIGDYAVVGIDVDDKLDRTRVGSIKYTVAESLQHDPYGAKAVVVADADTFERLKQMNKDIKNGRPVAGIMNELAAIVGRIIPQIPNDIKTNENPTKQNNEQLQQGEQKQLKQIQKKQSNGNL